MSINLQAQPLIRFDVVLLWLECFLSQFKHTHGNFCYPLLDFKSDCEDTVENCVHDSFQFVSITKSSLGEKKSFATESE